MLRADMSGQLQANSRTSTLSREEMIKGYARELGFDDCRITTAQAPASSARFQSWLGANKHGEMGYLARNAEKRIDPQKVLPGARSIITLANSYHQHPNSLKGNESGDRHCSSRLGIISRYAQYADYHDVLGARLTELTRKLGDLDPDAKSLWYVDTGPLLERDLAQRAGLGFIGKHTNLISRRLGNWFFLSEVITTIALEPDEPEKNRCGHCTRCITACPTAAITAPFELDARRCISYLTIELKGPIPVELRPLIGNRIYGCDDCLAACPWNRFAREGSVMKPHFRAGLATTDLVELLGLNETEFKKRFAGTPMLRTKRRGLLRNVCVALGNIGDENCLGALEKAAMDPEPLIAEHASWAIEQIKARKNAVI